jgi:hypothetical protein
MAEVKFPFEGIAKGYRSVGITDDDFNDVQSSLAYYLFLDVPDIDDRGEIVETILVMLDEGFNHEFLDLEYSSLLRAAIDGIIRTLPKDLDENDNNDVAWTLVETYLTFIFHDQDLPDASEEEEE